MSIEKSSNRLSASTSTSLRNISLTNSPIKKKGGSAVYINATAIEKIKNTSEKSKTEKGKKPVSPKRKSFFFRLASGSKKENQSFEDLKKNIKLTRTARLALEGSQDNLKIVNEELTQINQEMLKRIKGKKIKELEIEAPKEQINFSDISRAELIRTFDPLIDNGKEKKIFKFNGTEQATPTLDNIESLDDRRQILIEWLIKKLHEIYIVQENFSSYKRQAKLLNLDPVLNFQKRKQLYNKVEELITNNYSLKELSEHAYFSPIFRNWAKTYSTAMKKKEEHDDQAHYIVSQFVLSLSHKKWSTNIPFIFVILALTRDVVAHQIGSIKKMFSQFFSLKKDTPRLEHYGDDLTQYEITISDDGSFLVTHIFLYRFVIGKKTEKNQFGSIEISCPIAGSLVEDTFTYQPIYGINLELDHEKDPAVIALILEMLDLKEMTSS